MTKFTMAAPSLNPNTCHTVTQSSGGVIWEVLGSTGQFGRVYIGSLSKEEQEWVRKADMYHEAVKEDACYDDIANVLDEEVREREVISKAVEEMVWKKWTRGKKGKKQ